MTETTRPPFLLGGKADIKHLNVRKEGPDDAKVLAVDVKLLVKKVDARDLCLYFEPHLLVFLWLDELRDGKLGLFRRNAWMEPIGFLHQLRDGFGSIAGVDFRGFEIKSITIEPLDGGRANIGCSVCLHEPDPSDVAVLAGAVQDEVFVRLETQADLFGGGGGTDPKPKKTKAAKQAALALDDALREQGTTASVVTAEGDTLVTFGTGEDPKFAEALDLVQREKRASISFLQSHLLIGYTRAAKLLEALEAASVVSPMNSSGHREVLA